MERSKCTLGTIKGVHSERLRCTLGTIKGVHSERLKVYTRNVDNLRCTLGTIKSVHSERNFFLFFIKVYTRNVQRCTVVSLITLSKSLSIYKLLITYINLVVSKMIYWHGLPTGSYLILSEVVELILSIIGLPRI